MKSTNVTAALVAAGGFAWVWSGLEHAGLEQTLRLGIGCVMLTVSLVLNELAKWGRM